MDREAGRLAECLDEERAGLGMQNEEQLGMGIGGSSSRLCGEELGMVGENAFYEFEGKGLGQGLKGEESGLFAIGQ